MLLFWELKTSWARPHSPSHGSHTLDSQFRDEPSLHSSSLDISPFRAAALLCSCHWVCVLALQVDGRP